MRLTVPHDGTTSHAGWECAWRTHPAMRGSTALTSATVPAAGSDGYLTASPSRASTTSRCITRHTSPSVRPATHRSSTGAVGLPCAWAKSQCPWHSGIIVLQEIPRRPAHLRQARLPLKRFASTFYPRRQPGPAQGGARPRTRAAHASPGCPRLTAPLRTCCPLYALLVMNEDRRTGCLFPQTVVSITPVFPDFFIYLGTFSHF
jgi:hypothetical protein